MSICAIAFEIETKIHNFYLSERDEEKKQIKRELNSLIRQYNTRVNQQNRLIIHTSALIRDFLPELQEI